MSDNLPEASLPLTPEPEPVKNDERTSPTDLRRFALPEELSAGVVVAMTLVLVLAAAILRFYDLGHSAHGDSFLWFKRCRDFWNALSHGDLAATYRSPHPGVTYMWLGGISMQAFGVLQGPLQPATLIAAKVPVASVGALTAGLTFPLLLAITDKRSWRGALFASGMLVTEPYIVELSRMAHLDMLSFGLAWLGLLVSLVAYRRDSLAWAALAGALLSAGCMARLSMAPVAVLTVLALLGVSLNTRLRDRRGLRIALTMTAVAVVTAFAMLPALWVEPVRTVSRLLNSTEAVAGTVHPDRTREEAMDGGVMFYVRWLIALTPLESAVLALIGAYALYQARDLLRAYALPFAALLLYVLVIAVTPKKLNRYLLPLFPLLSLLGGVAFEWGARKLSRSPRAIAALALAGVLLLGARQARAAASLPSAMACTPRLGLRAECLGQEQMYSAREVALTIKADHRKSKARGKPSVYSSFRDRTLTPWLRFRSRRAEKADYLVLWYTHVPAARASQRIKDKLGERLGKRLTVLHYGPDVVVEVYRRRPRR